jgi:hypothetical protein
VLGKEEKAMDERVVQEATTYVQPREFAERIKNKLIRR